MTANRSHFLENYKHFPAWDCPTCGQGHLRLKHETLSQMETGASQQAHQHPEFDFDHIEKRFVGFLACDFALCREVAAVAGNVELHEDYSWDEEGEPALDWAEHFVVRSIHPAPLPIRPIDGTPDKVRAALIDAAGLLWQSPEAAANQVRQAVEHLMDCHRVRKQRLSNAGRQVQLTLHARIEEFKNKDAQNAEVLLAVKWLGNSGSHAGGLTRADVLDAFDMVELVLARLYGQTTTAIMRKVKAVNRAKGPSKK